MITAWIICGMAALGMHYRVLVSERVTWQDKLLCFVVCVAGGPFAIGACVNDWVNGCRDE